MTESTHKYATANWRVMRALLAKDWRYFRAPVIALVIVISGCYLIALTTIRISPTTRLNMPLRDQFYFALWDASLFSLLITSLLATAFGGTAIAGERIDRTADFLALLPITRKQIVISKLLVGGMAIAVSAGISMITLVLLYVVAFIPIDPLWGKSAHLAWWCGLTTSFYSVAWLFSTFIKSGPISACVSFAVTAGVTMLIACNQDGHQQNQQLYLLAITSFAIGFVSLISGTIYYLRRISP